MTVAALYIDPRGPYPKIGNAHAPAAPSNPRIDCWDAERDARLYAGPYPIVAHPPCGPWGRLRHKCKGDESDCAPLAVAQVRRFGGVLEHPEGSKLWGGPSCLNSRGALPGAVLDLPFPGDAPDAWGGFTIRVEQVEWGHVARKATWLYIVGVPWARVKELLDARPFPGREPTHWVCGSRRVRPASEGGTCPAHMRFCSSQQRRRTPVAFAEFLIAIAREARRP